MPSQLFARSEPVGSQLAGQCDLVRRASVLLVKEADSRPVESGLIAEQIVQLRRQGAVMQQLIVGSVSRSSFIDPAPANSLRLASSFDALLALIENCAQVLATHTSRHPSEIVSIACNLILQCVERLHECVRRCHSDIAGLSRHGKLPAVYAAIHTLASEISRMIQRERDLSGNEELDLWQLSGKREILETIEAAAVGCRDLAGLLEAISGLKASQL